MATDTSDGDLWKEALDRIDKDDKDQIEKDMETNSLQSLCAAAETERQECEDRELVVYTDKSGEKVKLRALLEKIASASRHFIKLGTLGVGFDPSGHAAAPWAVVQVLITGAAAGIETFKNIGEGLETVSDTISRYTIVEKIYLLNGAETREQLREKLLQLYGHILAYLAACRRYYTSGTSGRLFRDLLNAVTSRYKNLENAISEDEARKWMALADACLEKERDDAAVQRFRNVRKLLYQAQEDSMRIVRDLSAIKDNLNENERNKILEWMSTVNYKEHHTLARREVMPGTCHWLLESAEFLEWKQSRTCAFWLHGPAGTGKTSIVAKVIEHLRQGRTTHDRCPIAYFYCSRNRNEPERSSPAEIMGCILKQLASSSNARDPVRKTVVEEYTRRSENLMAGQTASKLSASTSADLCAELCSINPAYIVIDAVDECDELQLYDVVHELDRIMRDSKETVKVFISSRSHTDVPSQLHNEPISISIVNGKNLRDISLFIDAEVNRLHDRKLLLGGNLKWDLQRETSRILKDGARGMFRWVVLSLQDLRLCAHEDDYTARLGKLPPVLSTLYSATYEEIRGSGPGALESVQLVLSLLQVRKRLLSTDEIVSAVFSPPGGFSSLGGSSPPGPSPPGDFDLEEIGSMLGDSVPIRTVFHQDSFPPDQRDSNGEPSTIFTVESPQPDRERQKQQIIHMCRSFVILDTDKNVFRFSHPSVPEFMESLTEFRKDNTHARLAYRCMDELLHKDLTSLTAEEYVTKFCLPRNTELSRPFFDYARENWERHCIRVSAEDSDHRHALFQFLFRYPSRLEASRALQQHDLSSLNSDLETPETERALTALRDVPTNVLHYASRINSTAAIDEAVARGCENLDEPNWEGQTALYLAAVRGHISAARRLLQLKADPAVKSRHVANGRLGQFTPLVGAVYHQEHAMALYLISKTGIDLNDEFLIVGIASYGNEAVVKTLLKRHGLDPNALHRGNTLLAGSIRHRNTSAMKVLLDDTRVDKELPCVLRAIATTDWARSPFTTSELPSSKAVFEAFFNHCRVDVNSKDDDGYTALHHAVKQQSKSLVKFLLSHPKTTVDLLDNKGNSPLQIASNGGYGKILRLLKQHERKRREERGRRVVDGSKGRQS